MFSSSFISLVRLCLAVSVCCAGDIFIVKGVREVLSFSERPAGAARAGRAAGDRFHRAGVPLRPSGNGSVSTSCGLAAVDFVTRPLLSMVVRTPRTKEDARRHPRPERETSSKVIEEQQKAYDTIYCYNKLQTIYNGKNTSRDNRKNVLNWTRDYLEVLSLRSGVTGARVTLATRGRRGGEGPGRHRHPPDETTYLE
ncbi:hypothetical protein EVAR_56014_1 [Eumeta japonica]|uniref:Uncharacterized protein n=1 Tax=Eumeta variegata TaxID=151549 RepID=A0A4C1Z0L8_EUMVA|nr:hypothetical protein EVAR_56014_1 [Eumeta japonica]